MDSPIILMPFVELPFLSKSSSSYIMKTENLNLKKLNQGTRDDTTQLLEILGKFTRVS